MLETCGAALLEAVGVAAADARLTAGLLVDSDLAGHPSHGMLRLPAYLDSIAEGATHPRGVPRIVRRDGATAVVDGDLALGQVVARVAADETIALAGSLGVACVTVHRSAHVGRLAHVAERIAAAGQIGIVLANDAGAGQTVAPPGGAEPRLSTNPLAIAAPRANGAPFSLDMSTSIVSHGKTRVLRERGEALPDDWEVAGVLQSLGGYKGFGLALAVEVIAGILSQAGHSNAFDAGPGDPGQGMTIIAIDVARFLPVDDLARAVDDLAAYVASARLRPGAAPIAVPGELAAAARSHHRTAGIELTPATLAALLEACARLGVAPPRPLSAAAALPPR